MSKATEHHAVVIIGSGPAAYTAALYASRAMLAPLVYNGPQEGGQLTITTDVENYPGFPDGIMGPELVQLFKRQAERFGTRYVADTVRSVQLGQRPFVVAGEELVVTADVVIVATGASALYLEGPSIERLKNKGISACATCDGFFFRGQKIAVVGGGDTAMEEALYLTRFGTEVHVIHRRDELRASKVMQERAAGNEKIKFRWNTVIAEAIGENRLTALRLKDVKTGEEVTEDFGGLFMGIGHSPNTAFLAGQLPTDPKGYLLTQPGRTATAIPGVFVAGDCADPFYRQAVTAAGTGCMAAIEAERWLEAGGAGGH